VLYRSALMEDQATPRIRVQRVGQGLHPSEVVVAVTTADGAQEEVLVDNQPLQGDALEIGYPIATEDNRMLVELPRETACGSWRLWVPASEVMETERVP
jgi:hypothetical protein